LLYILIYRNDICILNLKEISKNPFGVGVSRIQRVETNILKTAEKRLEQYNYYNEQTDSTVLQTSAAI